MPWYYLSFIHEFKKNQTFLLLRLRGSLFNGRFVFWKKKKYRKYNGSSLCHFSFWEWCRRESLTTLHCIWLVSRSTLYLCCFLASQKTSKKTLSLVSPQHEYILDRDQFPVFHCPLNGSRGETFVLFEL